MIKDILTQAESKFKNRNISTSNPIIINIPELTSILGIENYPRGKMIEIFGKESIGKSTLSLKIIKEIQSKNNVVLIDAEHSFDKEYAKDIGVNLDNLLIIQPELNNQIIPIIEKLIKLNTIDMIILDSFSVIADQSYDSLMTAISKSNVCVIFLNQMRTLINKGSHLISTGNKYFKFYMSIRIEIKKKRYIKKHSFMIDGIDIDLKVVKNKLGIPFKTITLPIYYQRR